MVAIGVEDGVCRLELYTHIYVCTTQIIRTTSVRMERITKLCLSSCHAKRVQSCGKHTATSL
uniref:Uncharacterized protein n=1 Tax=Solanum tuberosum TaxID=4113 RepID=M1A3U8_SOLTU